LSEPFLNPVDKKVPGYYELIKYPMGKFCFLKIEFYFLNYGKLFNYIAVTHYIINYMTNQQNSCNLRVHSKMYNYSLLLI